jgi:hypothetical protein
VGVAAARYEELKSDVGLATALLLTMVELESAEAKYGEPDAEPALRVLLTLELDTYGATGVTSAPEFADEAEGTAVVLRAGGL